MMPHDVSEVFLSFFTRKKDKINRGFYKKRQNMLTFPYMTTAIKVMAYAKLLYLINNRDTAVLL